MYVYMVLANASVGNLLDPLSKSLHLQYHAALDLPDTFMMAICTFGMMPASLLTGLCLYKFQLTAPDDQVQQGEV